MPSDANDRAVLELELAQHNELTRRREALQELWGLTCWTAISAGLVVGLFVHGAGWIPPDTHAYPVSSGDMGCR